MTCPGRRRGAKAEWHLLGCQVWQQQRAPEVASGSTLFCLSLSLSLSHTHTHTHTHTRTHAPYIHPYQGSRRSSGCACTHLNEVQRGVYLFLRQGVCVVYFSVCVNARVLARPLLRAPLQTNLEQQQSICNFLHPQKYQRSPGTLARKVT